MPVNVQKEVSQKRKKSPRAPLISLREGLEKAIAVYERERRHAAPTDVVAQDLGYKSANNGAALSILASLRYYGLLERRGDGCLAVSKEVEDYNYAPSEQLRRKLRIQWLETPPIFSELLEKYESTLPSDAAIRYDLIQRGFHPSAAETVLLAFKNSIEFAEYFQHKRQQYSQDSVSESASTILPEKKLEMEPVSQPNIVLQRTVEDDDVVSVFDSSQLDRIPVRLPGNRKAWLIIPTPFFDTDKDRLKAQIDLLLIDGRDNANS